MRRLLFVILSVFSLQLTISASLAAQGPWFGFLVGHSFVGGGDSRTLVGSGVTGGDQAGLHLRAFADLPLEASPFSFRAELFYNRLTSGPSTYSAGVNGKAALVDKTAGLSGSFVASLSRPTLLLDWRYYQALYNTRGSAFMPISIGLGF